MDTKLQYSVPYARHMSQLEIECLIPHNPGLSVRRRRSPLIECHSSVSIRRAGLGDATQIWQVLKAAVTTLVGQTYTRAHIEAWIEDEAPQNLGRDLALGRTVFVAESEQRVIGFSRLCRQEVEALYVHPAKSRQRVGELLLRAVEESPSARLAGTLCLDAALNAVPFYRSAGYEVLGPSTPVFDNGVALPCIRMQKVLPATLGENPIRDLDGAYARISRVSPRSIPLPAQLRPENWPSRARCYRASLD